ncbi:hypothetical protein ACFZAD_13925 [Streptomyces iakyrus]|uniref:hypothetical protein n=1 Tax=Streptomyces iakyrus TaxID=68219 RepID=UPI0036E8C16F
MASLAYGRWQTERRNRLDDIVRIGVTAGSAGERVRWSRVVLLAAEFQGFARDLHDEAGVIFAKEAANGNSELESVLRARLTVGRQLARGNATPRNLGSDFLMLGVSIWDELRLRGEDAAGLDGVLNSLNAARNAVAHSNTVAIDGMKISENKVTHWHRSVDMLAERMEDVVMDHLADMFGLSDPWRSDG